MSGRDYFGMTREQAVEFVWAHTHKDFRSGPEAKERRVLMWTAQGTSSVPLASLPDDTLRELVASGVRDDNHEKLVAQGYSVLTETNGWAAAFDSARRPALVNILTCEVEVLPFNPADDLDHDERLNLAYDVAVKAERARKAEAIAH